MMTHPEIVPGISRAERKFIRQIYLCVCVRERFLSPNLHPVNIQVNV